MVKEEVYNDTNVDLVTNYFNQKESLNGRTKSSGKIMFGVNIISNNWLRG